MSSVCKMTTMDKFVYTSIVVRFEHLSLTDDEVHSIITEIFPKFDDYKEYTVYDYCGKCMEHKYVKDPDYVEMLMNKLILKLWCNIMELEFASEKKPSRSRTNAKRKETMGSHSSK